MDKTLNVTITFEGGRTFCRKTFCRKTFCRKDVLPNGHFADAVESDRLVVGIAYWIILADKVFDWSVAYMKE
jgi:hypothetical protein